MLKPNQYGQIFDEFIKKLDNTAYYHGKDRQLLLDGIVGGYGIVSSYGAKDRPEISSDAHRAISNQAMLYSYVASQMQREILKLQDRFKDFEAEYLAALENDKVKTTEGKDHES